MARKAAAGQDLILALDAGSPRVSVAVGRNGTPLAARAVAQEHSSTQLLALIDATLRDAGAQPADLAGLVAAAGPGSFTGLRVALATALGLHQALGVPAQAVSTLAALAAAAAAAPGIRAGGPGGGSSGDRAGDGKKERHGDGRAERERDGGGGGGGGGDTGLGGRGEGNRYGEVNLGARGLKGDDGADGGDRDESGDRGLGGRGEGNGYGEVNLGARGLKGDDGGDGGDRDERGDTGDGGSTGGARDGAGGRHREGDSRGDGDCEGLIVAAVDALRGEWSVQAFARRPAASLDGNEPRVEDEPPAGVEPLPGEKTLIGVEPPTAAAPATVAPLSGVMPLTVGSLAGVASVTGALAGVMPLTGVELVPAAELAAWMMARAADVRGRRGVVAGADGTTARPCLVAFGVAALGAAAGIAADDGIRLVEAWDGPPLAAMALGLAAVVPLSQWQPASLAAPIYARPPATTAPKPRRTMVPLPAYQDPRSIRRATGDDLPRLARLEAAAFADPWSSNQLATELDQTAGLVLLVAAPDSPRQGPATGYACFRHAAGEAELLRVAVLPAARRQGLARRLIAEGLSILRAGGVTECFLEVRPGNASALAVYHALGFHLAGRRERYYRDGSDALLYRLTL
jgi:[ribosomal protein S18]-alanine N-acetyltransferase